MEPRDRARERFDAGCQLGRRHRADRPPLVALALTLLAATPLAAQTRPPHWERFAAWRAELATDARAAVAAWGAKADARLAWLHEFATADRPTDEFDAWLAADADATLLAIRMALRDRTAADWRRVADESVRFVAAQKERGRFDAATASARAALAAIPPGAADLLPLHLELAECERRAYRWSAADAALAEAARQPGAASAASAIAAQRAALALARGLPDLAVAEVEAAERAAADPWQRAQALFVRLRLAHALRRPEDAIARLEAFLALPGPGDDDVATREAWQRRIAQLRIRAAIAALAEPQDVNASAAAATSWLRAAAVDPTTSSDERALALTTLTSHLLDRGEIDEAPRLLADARATLAAASVGDAGVDERRVAIATLTLRRARLARDAASRIAAGTELGALWRDLVDRWQSQPSSRVGEGPLHFGDLRRAFVELLRTRLDAGGIDEALDEVLRTSATGSLARRLGASAPTTAAARGMLAAAGAGALVFVVGHDASVAFAVDGSRTTAHVLPLGAAAIDGRRRDLLRALESARQTVDHADLDAACRRCGEALLPPDLSARIGPWPRVAIVGLDSIGYLPFELLRHADGQRLGVRHAVSYLPSLAIGVWLADHRDRAPATAPRVRLLACADTAAPADAPERPAPIPFDAADLAGSEAACAGVALEIRRSAEANARAAFATADFDFAQILAHGVRDERRSDPQGLLLGDGVVHWPAEVEGGRSAPYVWFAACRAGRGRLRRGDDGRHQLSGAALIAGARAVVLPVLDVGYRGALATSADVHRALWQEGRPLVDALQEARRAADARGPAGIDAFLFHLVGLGDRPLVRAPIAPPRAARTRALPWLAAAALAAWWLVRRRTTRAAR